MKYNKSIICKGFSILKSILDVKRGMRIPVYCEWEITDYCNMNCNFCGTKKPDGNLAKDISKEEAFDLINQLSILGTKIIHFTGGEPTLRDDLSELVRKVKEKNMTVSITTNGLVPYHKMSGLLFADIILVSIDGPEKFHDSVRSSPDAFKKAVETVKFLKSKNKKPIITSIYLENSSYKILEELIQIARILGVKVSIKNMGRNINKNITKATDGLRYNNLISRYFIDYMSVVSRLRKNYKDVVISPEPLFTVIRQGGLDVYGCKAMEIAICIKADGSISLPCNGLGLMVLKGNLKEIYYGKEAEEVLAVQGKHPVCKGCNIPCMVQASALLKARGLLSILDSYINNL